MKIIIAISSSSMVIQSKQHKHQEKENEISTALKKKNCGKAFYTCSWLFIFLPKVPNAKIAISQLDRPHNHITWKYSHFSNVSLSRAQHLC